MIPRRRPFKIEIFVAEGLPGGLRLITKSGWIGEALVCPRSRYPHVKKREEFSRSGVYILVGDAGTGWPAIYVGESDNIGIRIGQHYADPQKDFWQQAIIFTQSGTTLNKAQVRYLEARLLERADTYGRCSLITGNRPQRPRLSEADQHVMESFLDEILALLPVLGVSAFEAAEPVLTNPEHRTLYYYKGIIWDAIGFETENGFAVRKDSLARKQHFDKMEKHHPGYLKLRKALIKEGILQPHTDGLRFTQDHIFNSPSAAAAVCAGRGASGPEVWEDKDGISLKQHRKSAAKSD